LASTVPQHDSRATVVVGVSLGVAVVVGSGVVSVGVGDGVNVVGSNVVGLGVVVAAGVGVEQSLT
jgi:hypothetical protein